MFNKTVIALLGILFSAYCKGQENNAYTDMRPWSEAPGLHKLPESYKAASAVYLMDYRTYHYKFEGKNLLQFNYVYKLIRVGDDKGIELFNKIYLPISRNVEIYDIKARVITSQGKVINVPAANIKEEEQDGMLYKLFAMEGVDKGAEVEYSYAVRKEPNFFGSEIFQNEEIPCHKAKLLIITPEHLKFDVKGFNGFTVLKDTVLGKERITRGYSEDIKELGDEKYGLRDPYLQRTDFKLSYNVSTNPDVEMYTWKEFAKNAYFNLTTVSERENKAVLKFMERLVIPATEKDEIKIRLLEDYLKTHVNIDEKLVSEGADNLEAIVKTGNANNFGAARLFAAMLEKQGIKYQFVFPSVRNKLPLVEDLANWNRIDETLVYFPSTGKLVQPAATILRYPYIEPYLAGTRGLFLKAITIGDVKTAVGKFDDVPIEPFEQNVHNIEVHAKLDPLGDSMIVDTRQILKGYGATAYRPIWAFLPRDKQEETVKEILQSVAKGEHIVNIRTENTNLTDAWENKPLVISGTLHTAELLERAGNKLVFKVGELIGSQVQMYQEKPRQLPAEVQYSHILERKISFEIPDGYTIKNPDDLKIDVQHKEGEVVTMGFVSSYSIVNNVLQVHIMESYHELAYPLTQFEIFKNVINAAADFNKVTLVLEKTI